jgi:hypothetical protein
MFQVSLLQQGIVTTAHSGHGFEFIHGLPQAFVVSQVVVQRHEKQFEVAVVGEI